MCLEKKNLKSTRRQSDHAWTNNIVDQQYSETSSHTHPSLQKKAVINNLGCSANKSLLE